MMLRSLGFGMTALLGVFAAGCGDSASPSATGGLYFNLVSAAASDMPPGTTCNIKAHSAQIGSVPPSTSSHGSNVTDGENGAEVSCAVGGSFNGTMQKGNVSFFISGSVAKGGKGTAKVVEYDPQSLVQVESPDDKPCEVRVDTPPLTVGGGKIWAALYCPGLKGSSDPSVFCAASPESVFFFDHCD